MASMLVCDIVKGINRQSASIQVPKIKFSSVYYSEKQATCYKSLIYMDTHVDTHVE